MGIKIIKSTDVPRGKLFEVKVNEKVVRVVLTWHALDGADDYNISVNELINFLIYLKYYPDADALDIRISDEKPDYGEEAGEEMILHYTKEGKLVKIEILDASKTVIDFLEPILSQKPLAKAVSY